MTSQRIVHNSNSAVLCLKNEHCGAINGDLIGKIIAEESIYLSVDNEYGNMDS